MRGRPPHKSTDATQGEELLAESSTRARRQKPGDRPPDEPRTVAEEEAPRRKRGRPSLKNQTLPAQASSRVQDTPESEPPAPRGRKRGRPSLLNRNETSSHVEEQASQPPRKRGRPPLPRSSPSREQEHEQIQKAGRKTAQARGKQQRSGQVEHRMRQANRSSAEEYAPSTTQRGKPITDHERRDADAQPHQHQKKDQDENPPPSPAKPYPHVAPRIRRVRQATIAAKWSPLSGPSLSAASTLLHLAHRPILQRLSNTSQRQTHTSAALRLITHRIARKMDRGLPFPPASMPSSLPSRGQRQQRQQQTDGGRETELNFESVLDGKTHLERQLEPTAHAVEVLRREKDRMERELERDYEMLRVLEAGARAQLREQRASLKKAHALAPAEMKTQGREEACERDVVFTRDKGSTAASGGIFADLGEEEEIRTLALQLSGHVDSMRSNLQQTDGLIPQLARSRAALQAVLLGHLDQTQYECVVLG